MKKIILAFGIILLVIGCNNEQKQVDKMTTKLVGKINSVCQLTPDETTKLQPIVGNFLKLRKANKDKFGSDMDAFKKANESNRKSFIDTLKTILTPDQFEKLKTAFQQQRAKQNEQGGDQDGGGQD